MIATMIVFGILQGSLLRHMGYSWSNWEYWATFGITVGIVTVVHFA